MPRRKTLLEEVQDIVAYSTTYTGRKADIQPSTTFSSLDAQSEDMGILAALVEIRLNVEITLDKVQDLLNGTIQDLLNLIKSELGEERQSAPA